ncbi:MAG: FAD:protein FMN transferase [Bacteroidetes bacterium]|nr:FAD:protein FMN transferase [Bacteroidota bacterium]
MRRRQSTHRYSQSRRTFAKALGLAALGAGAAPLRSWGQILGDHRVQLVKHSTFVMGQVANVSIVHADQAYARRVITDIFAELRRLDSLMSVYDAGSGVSAVNRSAGREAVPVEDDLRDLLQRCAQVSAATHGALDITVEPLMRLWGFRGGVRTTRPTESDVRSALESVGMERLVVEGADAGLTREGAAVDLGGVAVGYALDRTAAIARRAGIDSALIELSGDFYAIGAPPDAKHGWEIGIVDPRHEGRIFRSLRIRDQGLSTSGNYESTVVYNAHRYGHIFDPSRGLPADRLLSATVVADTAFVADAYSTAMFVCGDRAILPAGATATLLRM